MAKATTTHTATQTTTEPWTRANALRIRAHAWTGYGVTSELAHAWRVVEVEHDPQGNPTRALVK
jgi:hypothetical protein